MRTKINYVDKQGVEVEAVFLFEGIGNQFKAIKIMTECKKVYPNFFNTKPKKVKENVGAEPEKIEAMIFCGKLVLRQCVGVEVGGVFEKLDFKTEDDIEDYFKNSFEGFIELTNAGIKKIALVLNKEKTPKKVG